MLLIKPGPLIRYLNMFPTQPCLSSLTCPKLLSSPPSFFLLHRSFVNMQVLLYLQGLLPCPTVVLLLHGPSSMRESLTVALGLLYAGEVPLSLEESQRWSGILFRWIFDKSISNKTHLTAIEILSSILENYGPRSMLIS
jgi:hypothetical protein